MKRRIIDKELAEDMKYAEEATNVSIWKAVALGAISTVVLYALLWVMQGYSQAPGIGYVITVFTDRGVIPYVITVAFGTGVWILILKRPLIDRQLGAFNYVNFPELRGESNITPEVARAIDVKIHQLSRKQRRMMIVRRVETAAEHLPNIKVSSEVGAILTTMSDIDHDIVDSSYSTVRYLTWIVPVLGFIGTVLGLSFAISGFGDLISGGAVTDVAGLGAELGGVTHSLGIAFDTTLLGLVLAGILTGMMHWVVGKEEALLSAMDEYCTSHIVERIEVTNTKSNDVTGRLEHLQGEFTRLFGDVSELFERGEAIKGVVKGVNEVVNFNLLLQQLQERLEEQQEQQNLMRGAVLQNSEVLGGLSQQIEGQQQLQNVVLQNSDVLGNLSQQIEGLQQVRGAVLQNSEVLGRLSQQIEGLQQLQGVVERNSEMLDALTPPIKSISKGIPITIGGTVVSAIQPDDE